MIKLLIVDDQSLFREGLRILLSIQPDIEVVGEAGTGDEALRQAAILLPDVILMDLRMPGMDGVEATRRLQQTAPKSKVIVLTTFDDDENVFEGLKAGAVGYLLKDVTSQKLLEAIYAAARGEFFLLPSITAKVVAEFSRLSLVENKKKIIDGQVESLTLREREVLKLVNAGKSNKEIADLLVIAEGTVKNHISNILAKLEVKDRMQASIKARDLNLF